MESAIHMQEAIDNHRAILARLRAALRRAGRPDSGARLLVVGKTWPADALRPLCGQGQLSFGESRLQEAETKIPALPAGLDWHFIGHIQKNKVRRILGLFGTLHSVDSPDLARRIDAIAGELGIRPGIFAEVNLASEPSKDGFSPEGLRIAIPELARLRHVRLLGLMAIPPPCEDPEDARPWFRQLRALRDELQATHGVSLPELSMGMSDDFEIAAEEGATIVRVGSAIFGARPTP